MPHSPRYEKARPCAGPTQEMPMDVPPRKPLKWLSEGTFHLGKNAKQDRIRLLK